MRKAFMGVVLLSVLVFLAWKWFGGTAPIYDRTSIVIASEPVVVLSYSVAEQSLLLVTFPPSLVTEGTHGYGAYSLSAFWRLGQIDKKDGSVLSESMTEALGVPVGGYIGEKKGTITGESALSIAKSTFSFGNMFSFLTGRYLTNISLRQFYKVAWMLHGAGVPRMKDIDFTSRPMSVGEEQELPDGSHQLVLSKTRLDNALKSVFEDTSVRREGVTVAVYNTTGVESLGDRIARLLTNIGVSVVTVGNERPEVSSCLLKGTRESLESATAQVITQALPCTPQVVTSPGRADLVVLVGRDYAGRFVPNK